MRYEHYCGVWRDGKRSECDKVHAIKLQKVKVTDECEPEGRATSGETQAR